MQCARHPKVETALSCGRCGTPICPDCAVAGAVGMICRDCASNRSADYYQIDPKRMPLVLVAGVAAGTVAGFLIQALAGAFFYFTCFLGPLIGAGVGQVVWRTAGRKRGLILEIIAGGSIVLGTAVALLLTGQWRYLLGNPISLAVFGVGVVLTVIAAVGKLRYF